MIDLDQYTVSDDKSLLSFEKICELLSKSYWASNRDPNNTKKAIENSVCYGVYFGNKQVGFARVVTDHSTMYWLCDLIIDEEHRGQGLGKVLVKHIVESDKLKGMFGLLGTKDAHGLYEKFGFIIDAEKIMRRPSNI